MLKIPWLIIFLILIAFWSDNKSLPGIVQILIENITPKS